MISGPDAVRPDIPGRRASSSSHALKTSNVLVRRLFRSVLCALSLYLSFIIVSPAGETSGDAAKPVNLFVDITSTRLAEEVKMKERRHVDLAGVPVVIGAARQSGDAAPSIAAGIAGGYDFDLGHHVSMKASGLLSRVHTAGAGVLSAARAGGDLAFRYQDGGTRLMLRPSLYAALQDEALDHVDYALESRLWQAIGWGLDLTASAGHSWRDSDQFGAEDRETGFGRLGLRLGLFDGGDLEFGYGFDATDGPLASQFRVTQGPLLRTHLAFAPGWRFSGRYGFSATERGYDGYDAGARRHDARHRLNLETDWDLASTTGADWHMKAAYDFEQTLTDDPVCLPATHAAIVSFALNF